MKRSFRSKVDGWYYLLMLFVPVAFFLPLILADKQDDLATLIIVGLIVTIVPVWLWLTTVYEIDDEKLLVRSGLFRWTILRNEITSIEPSRSVLSSPALSLDRLRIEYGANKHLLVSPEDKDEFVEALRLSRG